MESSKEKAEHLSTHGELHMMTLESFEDASKCRSGQEANQTIRDKGDSSRLVCALCGEEIEDYPGEFENGSVSMVVKGKKIDVSFSVPLCIDCAEKVSLEISGWLRFGSPYVPEEIRRKAHVDHWFMNGDCVHSFSEWKNIQRDLAEMPPACEIKE